MASIQHLAVLRDGVDEWNWWRSYADQLSNTKQSAFKPDFRFTAFENRNFRGANFRLANFTGAKFLNVDLTDADLSDAILSEADMINVKLCNTKLHRAELIGTKLIDSDLSGSEIIDAKLASATLIDVEVSTAMFSNCTVYGISTWNLKGEPLLQTNLIINPLPDPLPEDQEIISVDNIEVAQFMYLIANNKKIRDVIDTITSKVVLILGRFKPLERKEVLEALKRNLQKRNYVPVLFDFEKPLSQTTLETVSLLARMARFVVADITDAKSVLQELTYIVPNSPMLPVQPIILTSQEEPGMFDFFRRFPWVLKTFRYSETQDLLATLECNIIFPAEAKLLELRGAMLT